MSDLLAMNIETAQRVISTLGSAKENIRGEKNNLFNQINNMVGTDWRGQSANQFLDEFNQLSQSIESILTSLDNLQNQLSYEVAAWQDVASKL